MNHYHHQSAAWLTVTQKTNFSSQYHRLSGIDGVKVHLTEWTEEKTTAIWVFSFLTTYLNTDFGHFKFN